MLVLIMFQTVQLILEGDEAQTVVARVSTDAGKIPGAFGVDQHWCPVVLQMLGYGARTARSGLSRVLHKFPVALSPDRALIPRIWKGHDNAVQLKANFVSYFAQVLQLIKDGMANVRLLMCIPPFLWGGFRNADGVEQAVGATYQNGKGQWRWRPTGEQGYTTYVREDGTGQRVGPGTSWRVPNLIKVPTSSLVYAITNVFLYIRFNLGFDGGTLFGFCGTSPASALPDPFTETAKADMQKLYAYVRLPKGMTLHEYEQAHGDPSCASRPEEIEHANNPIHNRRQQIITSLPPLETALDGQRADRTYTQRRNQYVAENGDEDEDMGPALQEPERDRFEDPLINSIMERCGWSKLADDFVPPPGRAGRLRIDDSFPHDVLIRIPIVITPYSRQLTDAIFDVTSMALLKLMVLCVIHFRMRTLECCQNLGNAPLRALMKEQKHVGKIETNYNKRMKNKLGSKHAIYQTKTGDVPRSTSNGPNANVFQKDILKMRGLDLTQEGLLTGEVEYPSEWFAALQQTYLAVGNPQFVRHTLPRFASCMLDWAVAMEIAFKADVSDEDARLFELHLRRHTYALSELFGGGLCWYYFQGLKVVIEQLKDTRWLVGNSQQTVEHTMQTVRQAVRHTVHGAVGAPKKGVDRAEDLAAKRAKAPSEHLALFRNLLFHSMSAVRTFTATAPEVERMTFMSAWSLLCEKVTEGRTMVWSTLNAQWRYCRAMIHIYGKLRAHHRIHTRGALTSVTSHEPHRCSSPQRDAPSAALCKSIASQPTLLFHRARGLLHALDQGE
jgi:hypothetical protein